MMKRAARRAVPVLIFAVFCLLSGCLLLTGGALPVADLSVLDSPGGLESGTWNGDVTVLAVNDGWAFVRMSGWVQAASVGVAEAEGLRVQGSSGAGLWAEGVRIREDYVGDAEVTGRLVNTTGEDLEYELVEVVFIDEEGVVLYIGSVLLNSLPDGESRAFSAISVVEFDDVASVEFQM
jgi:hypothetical protein